METVAESTSNDERPDRTTIGQELGEMVAFSGRTETPMAGLFGANN